LTNPNNLDSRLVVLLPSSSASFYYFFFFYEISAFWCVFVYLSRSRDTDANKYSLQLFLHSIFSVLYYLFCCVNKLWWMMRRLYFACSFCFSLYFTFYYPSCELHSQIIISFECLCFYFIIITLSFSLINAHIYYILNYLYKDYF
jgi:hypothetical protein